MIRQYEYKIVFGLNDKVEATSVETLLKSRLRMDKVDYTICTAYNMDWWVKRPTSGASTEVRVNIVTKSCCVSCEMIMGYMKLQYPEAAFEIRELETSWILDSGNY